MRGSRHPPTYPLCFRALSFSSTEHRVIMMYAATHSHWQMEGGANSDTAPRPVSAPSGFGSVCHRLMWLHCLAVASAAGSDRVARAQRGRDDAKRLSATDDDAVVRALLLDRRIVLVRGRHVTSFTSGAIATFLPISDVRTRCC